MRKAIFGIVIAGLLVTAPRLALSYLKADAIVLPANWEAWIFGTTGIASGIVLTGGNALIAHVLADKYRSRGLLWWIVAAGWIAFLLFAVVLAAPVIVQGLQQSDLSTVLPQIKHQWTWAIVAVLSIEVLIAISMAAYVMHEVHEVPAQQSKSQQQPSAIGMLAGAFAERIRANSTVQSESESATPAEQMEHVAEQSAERESRQQQSRGEQVRCPQAERGCDYAGTQRGVNAHQRWCEYKSEPAFSMNGKDA